MLLSINDVENLQMYLNIPEKKRIHPKSGHWGGGFIWQNGHPYLQWNEPMQCFFIHAKLCSLHCRLGHLRVDKIVNVLKKPDIPDIVAETHRTLKHVEKSCYYVKYVPENLVTSSLLQETISTLIIAFMWKNDTSRGRWSNKVPHCEMVTCL